MKIIYLLFFLMYSSLVFSASVESLYLGYKNQNHEDFQLLKFKLDQDILSKINGTISCYSSDDSGFILRSVTSIPFQMFIINEKEYDVTSYYYSNYHDHFSIISDNYFIISSSLLQEKIYNLPYSENAPDLNLQEMINNPEYIFYIKDFECYYYPDFY